MANRSRPTLLKREKEKARAERQKQKEARRNDAKARRAAAGPKRHDGVDPDIAGITPGPQPLAEWQEEEQED